MVDIEVQDLVVVYILRALHKTRHTVSKKRELGDLCQQLRFRRYERKICCGLLQCIQERFISVTPGGGVLKVTERGLKFLTWFADLCGEGFGVGKYFQENAIQEVIVYRESPADQKKIKPPAATKALMEALGL